MDDDDNEMMEEADFGSPLADTIKMPSEAREGRM